MTVTAPNTVRAGTHESVGRHGGTLTTARITLDGRVVVHTVTLCAETRGYGRVLLWPVAATSDFVGYVNPDNPSAWCTATGMLREAGWRLAGDWSTVARYPTVRVEPLPAKSAPPVTPGRA